MLLLGRICLSAHSFGLDPKLKSAFASIMATAAYMVPAFAQPNDSGVQSSQWVGLRIRGA